MKEDNIRYEDAESFNPNLLKDRLTFRDILLQHLKKITTFASVEFIGGYWEEKPHPNPSSNATIKIYVPDTREVYSNAVECMADLLSPYFDEQIKEAEEVCEKNIASAFEKYANDSKGFESVGNRISYRDERQKANKRLFRELCKFLYRKKYLEVGSLED